MTVNALQAIDLDELSDVLFQLPESEVKQRFCITDLDSLNWAFRTLSALDAQLSDKRELAEKEMARIQEWMDKETKSIEQNSQFFLSLIEQYAREQRANNPKWKASTPYGKVGFRKQQPKWCYDEQKALEAIESAGLDQLLRVQKELDKTALKASVNVLENGSVVHLESGMIIEGISVIPQDDAVKVEVSSE